MKYETQFSSGEEIISSSFNRLIFNFFNFPVVFGYACMALLVCVCACVHRSPQFRFVLLSVVPRATDSKGANEQLLSLQPNQQT